MTDKAFTISGIHFDIVEKTPEEMGGCIGLADFNKQEVSINCMQTAQTKRIAIWHEVIHIMDSVYGLDLTEKQVVHLAHAMIGFVESNPVMLSDLGMRYYE